MRWKKQIFENVRIQILNYFQRQKTVQPIGEDKEKDTESTRTTAAEPKERCQHLSSQLGN